MAQIVLGFGSSHGPVFNPPEAWLRQDERDQRDRRFDYAELLRAASRPGLDAEIQPEKMQARYEACQVAVRSLTEAITSSRPDAVVVLSNPHGSISYEQMQPVFGIYLSASLQSPRVPRRPQFAGEPPENEEDGFPTDAELAEHLMGSLIEEGIDLACAFQGQLGTRAVRDHAYSVLYNRYLPDRSVPMVPFVISREPPYIPTPRRCYAVGQALRRAIEGWDQDKRVAVMASGGLSHQILDEELDRTVITALQAKDTDQLFSLPRDRLHRGGGTPEILNWITLAGTMEAEEMKLIDYVPCYRSLAGTGHGATFAYWR
jgi:aromatic ring-opening dioxygenase catalytic subunit (LigB family)